MTRLPKVVGWSRFVRPHELVLLAVFATTVWSAKWIADDGYIYLTYVQNAVDNGAGAVFNTGERVEAFTSPGWFALLSVLVAAVPRSWLGLPELTLLISIGISVAAMAGWTVVERRAARPADDRCLFNLPLALLVGVYVMRSFATSGLETPLVLLWCIGLVSVIWAPEPRLRTLAALAGLGPIVRPDLGLISLAIVGLVAFRWRRQPTPAEGLRLLSLVAIPMLVASALRITYFGQLAPNTY